MCPRQFTTMPDFVLNKNEYVRKQTQRSYKNHTWIKPIAYKDDLLCVWGWKLCKLLGVCHPVPCDASMITQHVARGTRRGPSPAELHNQRFAHDTLCQIDLPLQSRLMISQCLCRESQLTLSLLTFNVVSSAWKLPNKCVFLYVGSAWRALPITR